jgi:hypothetical protein
VSDLPDGVYTWDTCGYRGGGRLRWSALVLAACTVSGPSADPVPRKGGSDSASSSATTTPTTPTAPTTPTSVTDTAVVAGASCSVTADNAVRLGCTLAAPVADTFAVTVTEVGSDVSRRFETRVPATHAIVPVSLLAAETEYSWIASGSGVGELGGGRIVTGVLPAEAGYSVAHAALDPLSDHLLVPTGCGDLPTLTVADKLGRVVWYASFPGSDTLIAAAPTERDSFVVLLDRGRVVEVDLAGQFRLDLDLSATVGRPLHHDISVSEGRIQVLSAFETVGADGAEYVVDGVILVDAAGEVVGRWDLTDWITPSGGPTEDLAAYWLGTFGSALDWSHANTVQPGPPGTMLVSFRHLHTIVQVRSDPADPAFGEVDWWLSAPASVLDGGLVLAAGPDIPAPHDFVYQHHATVDESGRLLVFDNRRPTDGVDSRALALTLTDDTATIDQVWSLPDFCPFQGGAFAVGDDRVLVTCPLVPYVLELGTGGTVHRRFEPRCADGTEYASRIVPWSPRSRIVVD